MKSPCIRSYIPSFSLLLAAALAIVLIGCNGPTAQLSGTPVISTTTALDPTDPHNVAVYFYTDHPVHGLNFICTISGTVVVKSSTDAGGRAVCSRSSQITFYVGNITSSALTLGSIDLKIFGDANMTVSDGQRNYVAVTPATLYGTTVDSSRREVTNIFNLLYTLDVDGTAQQRHVIQLPGDPLGKDLHTQFSAVLSDPALPFVLSLTSDPAVFQQNIQQVAARIVANTSSLPITNQITFVHGGNALSTNPGTAGNVYDVTDKGIIAARAGIYRASALYIGNSAKTKYLIPSEYWMVTRRGDILGMGGAVRIDQTTSPSTNYFDHMAMLPGAKVLADGTLQGVRMINDANDFEEDLSTGRLVNDFLYGDPARLDPTVNTLVPANYVSSASDAGNLLADTPAQVATGSGTFYGGFGASPGEATLPDIDLTLLPANLLPLDLAIGLMGYPDGLLATAAQKASSAYWQTPPISSLLFKIQANGEIVSDVNGDCSPVAYDSNGVLRDQNGTGTQEYVIGQVGPIFTDSNNNPYITLLLGVYDQGHPAYGFTLGFISEFFSGHPIIYDVKNAKVISKACSPTAPESCTPPEWFNDAVYARQVVKPNMEQGLPLDPLERRNDYYGPMVVTAPAC